MVRINRLYDSLLESFCIFMELNATFASVWGESETFT